MYVIGSGSDDVFDDAHVEVDPNLFLTTWCDFEALELISNSTLVSIGFETNHLRIWQIYEHIFRPLASKFVFVLSCQLSVVMTFYKDVMSINNDIFYWSLDFVM